MEKYDLIIIGTGPAGLTAAIYAIRYKLNVLIIGEIEGGWTGKAPIIENFPSHEKISGTELITKIVNQVKKLGGMIKPEKVIDIIKTQEGFMVVTNNKYNTQNIILTTGTQKIKNSLKKEKELTGKGVSYCASCDAPFYKDKIVGISGGGNSALKSAILLSKYAKKVYLIYQEQKGCKEKPLNLKELKNNKEKITIINSKVVELIGNKTLEGIKLKNGKELKLNGLFIEEGMIPSVQLAEKLKIKLDCEHIIVDRLQRTNVKGIFAAGDVTNNPLKQIITACGEGAIAAHTIFKEMAKK